MSEQIEVPCVLGAKIVGFDKVTYEDAQTLGCEFQESLKITLDTGVTLYALRDPEGNGMGTLVGEFKGRSFFCQEEKIVQAVVKPKKKAKAPAKKKGKKVPA